MWEKLITRHPETARALVDAWQALGAADVVVIGPGQEIPQHPGDLVAPLGRLGYLVVRFGGRPAPPAAAPLLCSHATLLAHLLRREHELQEMTAELMRSYDQLVAMYHVSQASRTQLEPHGMLQSLVEQATRLTRAGRGLVGLFDAAGELERCLSYPDACRERERFAAQFWGELQQNPHGVVGNSPDECRQLGLGWHAPELIRVLVTPIRTNAGLQGFICLLNKPAEFDAADQKLVAALAEEAGALLERDRLYRQLVAQERVRRELEIAAEIQTGLLPRCVPAVAGVDLAGVSQPANEVGGDFYDLLPHPDGSVSILIGDVTGKGIPAALFMAVTRTILRASLPHFATSQPALARLNKDLYEDLSRASMFVTLFVARYHPAERRLWAANAGHSPVLHYHAGAVELWEADGPPIGVLPELLSGDQMRQLAPGDVVVATSDGLSEARSPEGELLGVAPLMQVIAAHAGEPAAAIQRALLEVTARHLQGRPPGDDQTIVVLKAGFGGSSAERLNRCVT